MGGGWLRGVRARLPRRLTRARRTVPAVPRSGDITQVQLPVPRFLERFGPNLDAPVPRGVPPARYHRIRRRVHRLFLAGDSKGLRGSVRLRVAGMGDNKSSQGFNRRVQAGLLIPLLAGRQRRVGVTRRPRVRPHEPAGRARGTEIVPERTLVDVVLGPRIRRSVRHRQTRCVLPLRLLDVRDAP